MLPFLPYLLIAAAIIGIGGLLLWLLNRWSGARATAAVAEQDKEAAQHAADNAAKAKETQHEIDRGSFGDAVDRL